MYPHFKLCIQPISARSITGMSLLKSTAIFLLLLVISIGTNGQTRIGVAGVTHGHVGWILNAKDRPDIQIVGIAEKDRAYALSLMEKHGIDQAAIF